MVLNDLIGELEKVELAGDLVRSSILHDVIDKAVSRVGERPFWSCPWWVHDPFFLAAGEARSYGAGGCEGEKGADMD